MTIIIGIDPGSRITGYGVIRVEGNQNFHVVSGFVMPAKAGIQENSNSCQRLQIIFKAIQEIVQLHKPQEAAIEQIFMHDNPGSALKLGQARGAAIVALGIPVAEYSARQVKQSVVGYGAAKKEQVQHMVKRLLNYTKPLQADEADALAIALCHAHTRFSLAKFKLTSKPRKRSSSWRSYQP